MEDNNLEQHAGFFAHRRRLKPTAVFTEGGASPENRPQRRDVTTEMERSTSVRMLTGVAEMERSTSFLNLLPDGGDYEKATKISEGLFSNKNTGVLRLMLTQVENMEIWKNRHTVRAERWRDDQEVILDGGQTPNDLL